jgi:hypothetical protein
MRFRRLGATTMLLAALLAGCATPPVETDSLPRSVYAETTAVAPWELLAAFDVRNDGQVLARDAFIPGASVLGVANADHWDVAVAFESISPRLGARASTRTFPREALLEAVLLYVGEALGAGANAAAIAAGVARPTTGATQ